MSKYPFQVGVIVSLLTYTTTISWWDDAGWLFEQIHKTKMSFFRLSTGARFRLETFH